MGLVRAEEWGQQADKRVRIRIRRLGMGLCPDVSLAVVS